MGQHWFCCVCGLTPTNASPRFHFYFLNFKEDHQGVRDGQEMKEKQAINLALRQSQGCPLSRITFLWSKDLKVDHKTYTFSIFIFTFQRSVRDTPGWPGGPPLRSKVLKFSCVQSCRGQVPLGRWTQMDFIPGLQHPRTHVCQASSDCIFMPP